MGRLKSIFFMLVLAVAGLGSCDMVHEFPQEGREVDPTDMQTTINVRCAIELAGTDIVTKSAFTRFLDAEDASRYERRFFVNIYSDESSSQLVEAHTIKRPVPDLSELVVQTSLHARKYRIVVWMDYVLKDTDEDLYYLTSNGLSLNAIHQPSADAYLAGSDFKDAQTFTTDIDLTPYAGQLTADITVPAPLHRPVAKITILADDLEEYASQIGYEGPLSELMDDISVEISYDGYYPTGFNAHTGRLNDAQMGYGFDSFADYPYALEGKDYSRLGFDYVFVNGESSSVTITVRIMSRDGEFINQVDNVVVPITRNRETVFIYKFFTKEYVPGIGIDPGFDGEFNVYV